MGNYRQSPMCRHCYQRGHTKNHCPQIKAAAENGEQWAKDQIERQKQSVKNRRCSYCGEKGHNKRSCIQKKSDKIVYDKIGKKFIEDSLKELKANGVTVGSLISYTPSYGETGTATVAYVTKIVSENRAPTWRWLNKHFRENQTGQMEYNRYVNNLKDREREDVYFMLQSMTGTGLGYWGDSETCSVECEDFNREMGKPTPPRFKVVG
jgi:hypothetical protein